MKTSIAGRAHAWAAFALALLLVSSYTLAESTGSRARLLTAASGSFLSLSGGTVTGQITTTFQPTVGGGTANLKLNQVSNSAPAVANYGGSLEFGGLGTAVNADIYLGAMQNRTSGNILEVLQRYGNAGGAEHTVFAVAFDGDLTQDGNLIIGANKSDGRLSSVAGSLYTIAANGPIISWNKASSDVVQWFTGAGGTQIASMSAAGRMTSTSVGVNASGTGTAPFMLNGTAPTISGFGGTGASVAFSNGANVFDINVGTGAPGNTGTINLPATTNGWVCACYNATTTTAVNAIRVTSGTASTCVIAQVVQSSNAAANFAASDHLRCTAFPLN